MDCVGVLQGAANRALLVGLKRRSHGFCVFTGRQCCQVQRLFGGMQFAFQQRLRLQAFEQIVVALGQGVGMFLPLPSLQLLLLLGLKASLPQL